MHHVNVEEVEEQPDAVIGKFLVKSFTSIVLFDSVITHKYRGSQQFSRVEYSTQIY